MAKVKTAPVETRVAKFDKPRPDDSRILVVKSDKKPDGYQREKNDYQKVLTGGPIVTKSSSRDSAVRLDPVSPVQTNFSPEGVGNENLRSYVAQASLTMTPGVGSIKAGLTYDINNIGSGYKGFFFNTKIPIKGGVAFLNAHVELQVGKPGPIDNACFFLTFEFKK